ncbi:Purine nucleoside phosphorylase isoform 2 [Schistosoma japonicum]|uniref:Purine nucleoside phosphorylase n=1 Tax=Schistosoma japonicum TaxID=6182 RepID=A0A4Z2DSS9_SCHJA|nr:Purine nucleoside phosphorylase isoform 2 [Schistosoma japonicum]
MNTAIIANYKNVSTAVDYIRKFTNISPDIGIICGSGLGKLVEDIEEQTTIPYGDIPNFPRTTASVAGHIGNLVLGSLGGHKVVAMQGRFHMYEGYTNEEIAFPIRVMKLLGVRVLLITNLAGGINRKLKSGDFVVIKGHINFPGFGLNNVLVGPNQDEFGPRFLELSNAYNRHLRQLALDISRKNNFYDLVHEGVYAFNGGPTYETPDESNMLLKLGCDAVGMSTVPEVLVAHHCGIKVLAISLIANNSILDAENDVTIDHEKVLAVAAKRADLLRMWFKNIITGLPLD